MEKIIDFFENVYAENDYIWIIGAVVLVLIIALIGFFADKSSKKKKKNVEADESQVQAIVNEEVSLKQEVTNEGTDSLNTNPPIPEDNNRPNSELYNLGEAITTPPSSLNGENNINQEMETTEPANLDFNVPSSPEGEVKLDEPGLSSVNDNPLDFSVPFKAEETKPMMEPVETPTATEPINLDLNQPSTPEAGITEFKEETVPGVEQPTYINPDEPITPTYPAERVDDEVEILGEDDDR